MSKETKKMLESISDNLTNLFGEGKGQEIFAANFTKPKGLDCYMPGEILTFAQLKALLIHIHYLDEDGHERTRDFEYLDKNGDDDEEWCAGDYPFPITELDDEDRLERIDNSGWTFTIRGAVPAKKGEYAKITKDRDKAVRILEKLKDLHYKYVGCTDKAKKKKYKDQSKELEKQLKKMGVF